MKSFKNILSEVAQPKSSEEKAFKDQHNQKPGQHPVAPDSQFSGDIGKTKAARPADQEDDANYDQAYGDKPDQEPVLRKGRKFSQFRANESKEMATQAALDKATAASKEGKKKVTLAKAPWDKKEEVSEKVSDLAFAKWNEALSGKQKKLDHNKNGKIDGHDFAIMRTRKKSNEEVDVVETTSSAMKHMVTQTGPDGKTRTVMKKLRSNKTDDRGQDVIKTNESFIGTLDEAIRVGNLRLKNGKNAKVSKQDAKLLNDFYKNLNAKNRRDMEKVMMKDEAGFKEIVGFAREAL